MIENELATTAGIERVTLLHSDRGGQLVSYETIAAGADVTFTDMLEHFSSDCMVIEKEGKMTVYNRYGTC